MATLDSVEGDTFGSDVDEAGGSEVPKFSVHKLSVCLADLPLLPSPGYLANLDCSVTNVDSARYLHKSDVCPLMPFLTPRRFQVRCDRVNPCGPCSRKALPCSYPAGFKPRAKRQRALVSDG